MTGERSSVSGIWLVLKDRPKRLSEQSVHSRQILRNTSSRVTDWSNRVKLCVCVCVCVCVRTYVLNAALFDSNRYSATKILNK
jgi:hypothetical protein